MVICHITISPIDYERRIQNQAGSASEAGYNVWIVAMGKPFEKNQEKKKKYLLWRIHTPYYRGGPLKFLHFNWKLVLFLFKKRPDIIHCHDLWVLPAAVLPAIFIKCKLIYDAHEYYPGLEIFTRKKIRCYIWLLIEKLSVHFIDYLITVSKPLGKLYKRRYRKLPYIEIIRNLPKYEKPMAKRVSLIDTPAKKLLFHGHFRPGRGLLNLVQAVSRIPDVHLILIGDGELKKDLKKMVYEKNVDKRVSFFDYIATDNLISTASQADIGVVLFEPTSINYRYALPNKFFEYIMAGLPLLASNICTFRSIISKYDIGLFVDPSDIDAIVKAVEEMIGNNEKQFLWRKNSLALALSLNWETEEKKLLAIYEKIQ